MVQLLEPGKLSKEKHFLGYSDPLKDFTQLTHAELGGPATPEFRQMTTDPFKGGAIAVVVAARPAKGDRAAFKDLSDDGGNFPNSVVLLVVADIEDLVVHRLARRLQCEDDRLANVLDVDKRPPRRHIARHSDLFGGPGEPGEVIEDNVEPHARADAKMPWRYARIPRNS